MTAPIFRQALDEWVDPMLVHAALVRGYIDTAWLDAGPDATEGFSYLAPVTRLAPGTERETLASISVVNPHYGEISSTPRFTLGWIGWIGYEFGAAALGVPTSPSRYPDIALGRVDALFEFDHAAHTVSIVGLSMSHVLELVEMLTTHGAADEGDSTVNEESPQGAREVVGTSPQVLWRHSPKEYESMVEQCRDHIRNGDAYQLCLTNEVLIPGDFSVLEVYRRLRKNNPSHHGALLRFGSVSLLSSSPEIFVRMDGHGTVRTLPIKGTRPRGVTPELDDIARDELLASSKERAENLMIVDLMRNDLSRIAVPGTVVAEDLLRLETLPHVHQLVSTVSARLRDDTDALNVVEALFPAGSMTGAPKIAAMRILNQLELGTRGIYSGCFGWFGQDGAAELAMVIRSVVIDEDGASLGTGGGITIDSDPVAEREEAELKARAGLTALGVL